MIPALRMGHALGVFQSVGIYLWTHALLIFFVSAAGDSS